MHNYFCLILTTTNKKEIAKEIASEVILEKLSNCVQICPVESYYIWQGEIKFDNEFRLTIKARKNNYQLIENLIKKMHNYELPEIIQVEIEGGSKDYLDWLSK